MKKIIYSLVIMIAAGSLFTSCVENTEPAGIKDLREAKAGYLDALSKVREADARYRDAKTALKNAEVATEQARAALKQAYVKAKELANEATALDNEQKAAQIAANIEAIKAKAEQDAVDAEKTLAEKQQLLEQALRKIAAEAIGLTGDEKDAIRIKTDSLRSAQSNYHGALVAVEMAERAIWEKEYDLAVGYDVEPDTAKAIVDYSKKIKKEKAAIAEARGKIAADNALLEEPSEVEAYLKAFKDSVKAMEVDTLQVAQAKTLYEASALKEANHEYALRWNTFYNDSIGDFKDFAFNKKGKAIAYDMNVVYGTEPSRVDHLVEISAKANGIGVSEDQSGLGLTFSKSKEDIYQFIMPVKGPDTTSKILYGATGVKDTLGLVGIVDALKRDLVLVNGNDSAEAAKAVEAARVADSTYKADRAILEAGLDSFSVYKLAKDTVKMFQDTVAEAKAKDTAAMKKVAADSTAIKDAIKAAADGYIDANKAFAKAVNDIISGGDGISQTDSTEFIKATIALGEAQAAYFGFQDSLTTYTLKIKETGEIEKVRSAIAFSDLKPAGFVVKSKDEGKTLASLYGGIGYGAFAGNTTIAPAIEEQAWYRVNDVQKAPDAFVRVINVALNSRQTVVGTIDHSPADVWTRDDAANWYKWTTLKDTDLDIFHNGTYKNTSNVAYHPIAADTVAWLPVFANIEEAGETVSTAYATLATDDKAQKAAHKAVETAVTKLGEKQAAVNEARDEYYGVYAKFFGISKETAVSLKDTVAKKFAWTAKTFEEPFLCVWFNGEYTDIVPDPTLTVILEAMDSNYDRSAGAKGSGIFWNGNWTEYALKLQAEQKAYVATHYTEILDQLANIEEAVDQACEDFEDAYTAWEEQTSEQLVAYAKLVGVGKNGKLLDPVKVLSKDNVANGEWALGGYQKEWADELAPEYPEIVSEYEFNQEVLSQQITDTYNYIELLEDCYVAYKNFIDEDNEDADLDAMIGRLEGDIRTQEAKIKKAKNNIVIYEKALAEIEMGYDVTAIQLKVLYDELEVCQNNLKVAEEALARAQKEYDEVIAKYGVTE